MIKNQPISNVQWIPIEKVFANQYNPNSVATMEMKLLYTSVKHDGFTQPIVTIYDKAKDRYVIVDGFHRYSIMKRFKDIHISCEGKLPCVVLEGKTINDCMASTIRHNRARGKHSVSGMSSVVMEMLMNGASDIEVCNELGLEAEEIIRLKHITGYAKLYSQNEYSKAFLTEKQVAEKIKYENEIKKEKE
jgi:ParB-like chromosome segregation protein Spo0J